MVHSSSSGGVFGYFPVLIRKIEVEANNIRSYELVDPRGNPLPKFTAGSHLEVSFSGRTPRQYSLCNDPEERHRYLIAVLREPGSGTSSYIHDCLTEGDRILISAPRNNFPLDESAAFHLLIAGGIGITPILSMSRRLEKIGAQFALHYCARSPEAMAFRSELTKVPFKERVALYFDGGVPSRGVDIESLVMRQTEGTHLYCCGPTGLIKAAMAATKSWPGWTKHFELFKGNVDRSLNEAAFEIEIESTGQVFNVPGGKTILEVLRENGFAVASSCEEGVCGTCATPLRGGIADHRDNVLTEAEKNTNTVIMPCCSRAQSSRLKLGL